MLVPGSRPHRSELAAVDSLQRLLTEERAGGQLVSSGRWTLAAGEAIKKMGAFQLPSPEHWVLKAVQAAVAAGSAGIEVRVFASGVELRPGVSWTADEVLHELVQPEPTADRALDHLKRALWSLALGQKRAVLLELEGQTHDLAWKDALPVLLPRKQLAPFTRLMVSDGPGSAGWLWRWRHAPRVAAAHASLAHLLRLSAWTCPVPLQLDAVRLDGFHRCPTHGGGSDVRPLGLVTLEGEELQLPIQGLAGLATLLAPEMPRARCALLISEGRETQIQGRVYWVQDGVALEQQRIFFAEGQPSGALLLSAQGLPLDATGFALADSAARGERLDGARWALVNRLQQFRQQLCQSACPPDAVGWDGNDSEEGASLDAAQRAAHAALARKVDDLLARWTWKRSDPTTQLPLHPLFYGKQQHATRAWG